MVCRVLMSRSMSYIGNVVVMISNVECCSIVMERNMMKYCSVICVVHCYVVW